MMGCLSHAQDNAVQSVNRLGISDKVLKFVLDQKLVMSLFLDFSSGGDQSQSDFAYDIKVLGFKLFMQLPIISHRQASMCPGFDCLKKLSCGNREFRGHVHLIQLS